MLSKRRWEEEVRIYLKSDDSYLRQSSMEAEGCAQVEDYDTVPVVAEV